VKTYNAETNTLKKQAFDCVFFFNAQFQHDIKKDKEHVLPASTGKKQTEILNLGPQPTEQRDRIPKRSESVAAKFYKSTRTKIPALWSAINLSYKLYIHRWALFCRK
jgi:hypothetical protein